MLNIIFKILIIYITLLSSNVYGSSQNKIVVKVQNQIITSYELKNKIKLILFLSNQELNQQNINMTKNSAIKNLINYKIKKEELIKFKISASENAVNNQLENIYDKFQTDSSGFKKIFENQGLNIDFYLDEIRTELSWQSLIFKLYNDKIDIDDNAVNKELNEIIQNQKNIEEIKLAEIEIILESDSKDTDRVNELLNQIKILGFENAAIKFSTSPSALDGGEIGWVNLNALSSNIKNLINDLKIGEISKPLIQSNSAMFFKVLEKRNIDSDNIDQEKLRETIISGMKNDLFNLYSNSHVSKLKNDAFISFEN